MLRQDIVSNAKLETRGQGNKDAYIKAADGVHEVERFRTESLRWARLERGRIPLNLFGSP
jgi:hypothetical protein